MTAERETLLLRHSSGPLGQSLDKYRGRLDVCHGYPDARIGMVSLPREMRSHVPPNLRSINCPLGISMHAYCTSSDDRYRYWSH